MRGSDAALNWLYIWLLMWEKANSKTFAVEVHKSGIGRSIGLESRDVNYCIGDDVMPRNNSLLDRLIDWLEKTESDQVMDQNADTKQRKGGS